MIENHCLFIDLSYSSVLVTNNKVTEEAVDCVNATLEHLLNWTHSLVSTSLNNHFDYIASPSTAIEVRIGIINGNTVDSASYLTKLNIKFRKATSFLIKFPKFDCIVVDCNELCWIPIVILDVRALLVYLVCCKLDCLRFTFTHVPTSDLVYIS